MTVGFADLSNFVKLVEAAGDVRSFEALQQTFSSAGDIIVKNNGAIRKYLGDTILFTFLNPSNAMRTARELVQAEYSFDDIKMRFNIGLATGVVIIAKVGHPSFMVEDIFGEVVNRAAILSKQASQTGERIKMCAATAANLQ